VLHRLESVSTAGKALLVKLVGVDSREQADALRGAAIEVPREAPADQETPYLVDLVGAEVETPDGPLGRVVDIVVNPTTDCVIVERPGGERVEVVLRSEYIAAIDARRIVLASSDAILG
jgi:16S rRNA processing protein RimM